jgi:hypothetical protein
MIFVVNIRFPGLIHELLSALTFLGGCWKSVNVKDCVWSILDLAIIERSR